MRYLFLVLPISFCLPALSQSLYEQRAREISQQSEQRAEAAKAAYPSQANAYFRGCIRTCYGNVQMTTVKGEFPYYDAPGIISSVEFIKNGRACYASWPNPASNILVNCIDGNHRQTGMKYCCPGFRDQ